MKRALLLALVLVGCRASSGTPPTSSKDVNVAAVTAPPIATKQSCGPDASAALEVDQVLGRPIRGICIRGTDDGMREDVRAYVHLRPGDKVFEESVRRDVVDLYESGFFRRIDVLAANKDDGVELTFELELRGKPNTSLKR